MSWFDEEGSPTSTDPGTTAEERPADPPKGDTQPNLSGKPDWVQDQFWIAPKEGEQPDYSAMLRKANDSFVETRKKVSDQGEQLAKYTVPDSVAPYLEGIDPKALVEAAKRSGFTEERVQQWMAQARSTGIGPAPAQAMLQSWAKSLHEATPEPKTPEAQMDAAVAELNGQGRPGSEMARRMRGVIGKMVTEGTLSKAGAEALVPTSAAGIEALSAILGATAAGPAGRTDGRSTVANRNTMDELTKRMGDPNLFGDAATPAENAKTLEMMRQHDSLIQAKYGDEIRRLENDSLTTHPAG